MLTLWTVNNVLTQSLKQILNEQTDYNYIVNSVKISMIILIMSHLKDFFLQTLEDAKTTARINWIYIINQIIIHKIRKFNNFSIFSLFKLSDYFFSTFILSIIFLDFILKFQKHFYHDNIVDKNLIKHIILHRWSEFDYLIKKSW